MKKSLYLVLLLATGIHPSNPRRITEKQSRQAFNWYKNRPNAVETESKISPHYQNKRTDNPDFFVEENTLGLNPFASLAIDDETGTMDPLVALSDAQKQPSKKAQKREKKKAAAALALSKEEQPAALSQPKAEISTSKLPHFKGNHALAYPKRDFRNEGYGRGKGHRARRRRKNSQEYSGVSRRTETLADIIPCLYEDEKQQPKSTKKPDASTDIQQERPVCLDREEEYSRYNKQTTVNPLFNQDFPSISPQQGLEKYAQEHRKTVEDERQARQLQRIKEIEDEERRGLEELQRRIDFKRRTSMTNLSYGYGCCD